jgi:hypothetical protein
MTDLLRPRHTSRKSLLPPSKLMDPYPADAYLYQQCGMHPVEVGDDEMAVREHGVVGIALGVGDARAGRGC